MYHILKLSLSLLLPFFLALFLFKWFHHIPKNLPPSPPKLPIIGNLHQLGSIPHLSLKSLAQKYGPVMLLHLGRKPVLVISSSDAAEQVLRKNDSFFADRPKASFVGRIIYDFRGVAFSPYGEYWKQLRGICITQLLSNRRVQSFRAIREEEVAKMLEKLRESCLSGSTICISEILAALTNNIVSMVALEKRYSTEKNTMFKELFENTAMLIGQFNIADYIPWLGWINHINGLEAKVGWVVKEFDKYLENIVEDSKRRMDGESDWNEEQKNFVHVLLQVQRENASINRSSIKAMILDMLVAGSSSTSSLLEWVLSELIKNPNAMTKLQTEVRELSDHISEDDLEKLPYLNAVIKETLRMHPPIPLFHRETRKAMKIMGYDIAAKTQVIVNTWMIGREPLLWEEADKFRPERFLNCPVEFKGQHFQFIPFGSGRRSCPGSGFAMVTTELTLANLIRNFNFALAGEVKHEELDMTEAHGLVTARKFPLLLVASLPG